MLYNFVLNSVDLFYTLQDITGKAFMSSLNGKTFAVTSPQLIPVVRATYCIFSKIVTKIEIKQS
jgi:hypothetical protein